MTWKWFLVEGFKSLLLSIAIVFSGLFMLAYCTGSHACGDEPYKQAVVKIESISGI